MDWIASVLSLRERDSFLCTSWMRFLKSDSLGGQEVESSQQLVLMFSCWLGDCLSDCARCEEQLLLGQRQLFCDTNFPCDSIFEFEMMDIFSAWHWVFASYHQYSSVFIVIIFEWKMDYEGEVDRKGCHLHRKSSVWLENVVRGLLNLLSTISRLNRYNLGWRKYSLLGHDGGIIPRFPDLVFLINGVANLIVWFEVIRGFWDLLFFTFQHSKIEDRRSKIGVVSQLWQRLLLQRLQTTECVISRPFVRNAR